MAELQQVQDFCDKPNIVNNKLPDCATYSPGWLRACDGDELGEEMSTTEQLIEKAAAVVAGVLLVWALLEQTSLFSAYALF